MSQLIYFMQCNGPDGPIKIGRASNPKRRLGELRIGCPYPIELLAEYLPDGDSEAAEDALHAMFAGSRMSGEWFACTPALLELVSARRSDMGDRADDLLSAPKGASRHHYFEWRGSIRRS